MFEQHSATCQVDADIRLELVDIHHAPALFALTDANRQHLRRWLPWLDATTSPDDTRNFIAQARQKRADNGGYEACIVYQGQLAGMIGQRSINWPNRTTEIGYWLSAALQGRGIMTRACRALVACSFESQHLNRVQIRCALANRHSRAIPERLGFQQEGTLRESAWLYDHFVDVVIYSMLRREWPARL
jgi:ribosomal-protein-serine acetyltransferase